MCMLKIIFYCTKILYNVDCEKITQLKQGNFINYILFVRVITF